MHRALALALLACPLAPSGGLAATEPYGVRLPANGLVVDVPYSLGTHHEHVTEVQGVVRVDAETLQLERGRLVIPLAAFRSDDPQRGCHLREALGLDYARSRFPREHVCDGQNRLPSSGPDAIAYPEIVVELSRGGPTGKAPAKGQVEVEGTLTAHGVSRQVRLDLTVARDPSGLLRVHGRVPLRLSEFGITVKSAQVLFVSISVRDEIALAVDVLLEPVRGAARSAERRGSEVASTCSTPTRSCPGWTAGPAVHVVGAAGAGALGPRYVTGRRIQKIVPSSAEDVKETSPPR